MNLKNNAGMQSKHTVFKLAQLRWTGHVIRMLGEQLPKKSSVENYRRESAKKRYKDTLKVSLKDFHMPIGSWEQTAQVSSTKEQFSMKLENVFMKHYAPNW